MVVTHCAATVLVVVEVKGIVDVMTVTGVKMLAEMRISVTGTTVLMGEVD